MEFKFPNRPGVNAGVGRPVDGSCWRYRFPWQWAGPAMVKIGVNNRETVAASWCSGGNRVELRSFLVLISNSLLRSVLMCIASVVAGQSCPYDLLLIWGTDSRCLSESRGRAKLA